LSRVTGYCWLYWLLFSECLCCNIFLHRQQHRQQSEAGSGSRQILIWDN